MSEWQPIENAPDNEAVLACWKRRDGTYEREVLARKGGRWYGHGVKPREPIVWMPLPAAPKERR